MKKTTLKQCLKISLAATPGAVHSWTGKIFRRFLWEEWEMEKKIADQKDAEKMERAERKIIKEQGKKGVIVYRYSDFHEEIDESDINFSNLGWRFDIIMEKFKIFLDMFEFNEENMRYGIVLGAIIKDAERELEDISGFIDKTVAIATLFFSPKLKVIF